MGILLWLGSNKDVVKVWRKSFNWHNIQVADLNGIHVTAFRE
jgi:hypothetical protein